MKGKRFEDIDAIKKNTTSTLNTIPERLFQKLFLAVAGPLEAVCQLTRRVF
jgi:hypothetical protein